MSTIVLPEYTIDDRITKAAQYFSQGAIRVKAPKEILEESNCTQKVTAHLRTKKKFTNQSHEECINTIEKSPLLLGALLVDLGYADGLVAGAHYATADVLRAGIHIIGTKEGTKTASSSFVMTLTNREKILFADCAVIAHPTALQLAEIAIASVSTASQNAIENPSVAFLSFSTHGSASDKSIDTIKEAMKILKTHPQYTGFTFDGEVQFDTAIIPEIAKKKAPESPYAKSPANILIFPNLNAGNITYKAVERLAGAKATGPILQGFKKPINDLSRGCNIQDIVEMIKITARQSQSNTK